MCITSLNYGTNWTKAFFLIFHKCKWSHVHVKMLFLGFCAVADVDKQVNAAIELISLLEFV